MFPSAQSRKSVSWFFDSFNETAIYSQSLFLSVMQLYHDQRKQRHNRHQRIEEIIAAGWKTGKGMHLHTRANSLLDYA